MSLPELLDLLAKSSYFAAALLFIIGLMQMGSPVTAKRGIRFKATQHDQIDIIANNIKMIADVSMSNLFPTY